MNRRHLTNLLEHLPKIPISQLKQDQRSCGICWDAFNLISPFSPDSLSPKQEESAAGETAPFMMYAFSSTGHVVVKTEVCVEREMLPEMCTHYQRRQEGENSGSGGFDDLSRLRAVDDPVQLQCGHMFGRKCLRSW